MGEYIKLNNLEVYKLARELSELGWKIYQELNWKDKKIMGDQFIESTDSIGANLAEGYGRYHYLDQIKFYYNGRGSFNECYCHWLSLLWEREKVSEENYKNFKEIAEKFSIKLNNFITSVYKNKKNQ